MNDLTTTARAFVEIAHRVEWAVDDTTCIETWERFKHGPPPVGYDPLHGEAELLAWQADEG